MRPARSKRDVRLLTLVDVGGVGLLPGLAALLLLARRAAAVFLPASFFSAGALPAGALPPVVGFFSAALGAIFDGLECENAKRLDSMRDESELRM